MSGAALDSGSGSGSYNAAATSAVLGAAECKKILKVGKVVSCVDWLVEEGALFLCLLFGWTEVNEHVTEVFVVGFHDVG